MIKRSGPDEVLHEVVEHDKVLHLSGVVAEDMSLDMAGQTTQVLEQIDTLLAAHGSHRNLMLSALVFITDMSLKKEMNKVWVRWFSPEHLPTRATIGVKDLGEGVLLEVVVTAAVG